MDVRRFFPLAFILFVPACSSSSSTAFGTDDSGTPPPPGDGGVQADGNAPPGDSNLPPPGDGSPAHDGASPSGDSGGDGGVYDFGCGGNTACPLSTVCCTMPGNPATFGCVNPANCPSGDKIACDGPDECVGTGTPICCGVAVGNGQGSFPSCGASALGTSCTSTCTTHTATSCSDTSTVQICHFSPDCMDPAYPNCCTFTSNGSSLTFCADNGLAAFGTCHP
jgi:hypothetical protein